ncbi:peptidase M24 [Lophium mytilinum]|uniref:Peptidase M24 n=1 Tax=Lophium mytilinum TaxID=390894 RepID=A0A6A6QB13_9PEZI|nr:peptidase M24 [Lophium mytilinum]
MNGTKETNGTSKHVISEESIQPEEFQQRIATVRKALQPSGLIGLIAFGDCWRGANVCYFTEFRPLDGVSDIANALFFLGVDSPPILFVSKQCVDYASEVTTFAVHSFDELNAHLSSFASKHSDGVLGLAGEAYIPEDLHRRIKATIGPLTLTPHPILAEIKAVKSPAEIALIRKASALTDIAMMAIQKTLSDGHPHTERELALDADRAMLAHGADRTAYDSMVQAGPRSAFNLARPTDRVVQPGDLVMTDIGARYRGYVADGGRGFTYGAASEERRAIVRAAAAAVEAGLEAARPGITCADLNAAIQAALVESGYEKYSSEARGHGTGHGTGMDPEEEQPWIGPGNRTVLRENMVFTLKATITVPGVGGLRTERIVRLTADGVEPLDVFPMELYW